MMSTDQFEGRYLCELHADKVADMDKYLDKPKYLYKYVSEGKKEAIYKICDCFKKKKEVSIGRAKEVRGDGKEVFLKLARISHPNVLAKKPRGSVLRDLERESRFQFYYPFIEQVYGDITVYRIIHEDGENKFYYYYGVSVEYVKGMTIKEKWIERGKDELDEDCEKKVFRNMLQFLYGMRYYLEYAKPEPMKWFLHRDIKPENVMIDTNGNCKIIDFDVAHISGSEDTINKDNSLGFSYGYVSPEVLRKGRKRPQTIQDEFYSAGRFLFAWLNGLTYYDESESDYPEKSDSELEDPLDIPYIADDNLGYGTKAERYREKYRGSDYAKLRYILDKMCRKPSGDTYNRTDEIIDDFFSFLKEKYNVVTDAGVYELLKINQMPLLCNDPSITADKNVPYVYYKINDRNGWRGKSLYQYGMRDIKVNNILEMTYYNIDNKVYYIPMGEKKESIREGEDEYQINDGDVFTTADGTRIEFNIEFNREDEKC